MKLEDSHPGLPGLSIIEMLWEEMDTAYAELRELGTGADSTTRTKRGVASGKCLGLATAIAIMTNPYAPNVDAVRSDVRSRFETKSEDMK